MLRLVALLLGLFLAAAAPAQDFSAVAPLTDRAVGRIIVRGDDWLVTGAGVVVGTRRNGALLYVTNQHVIARGGSVAVVFKSGGAISIYRGTILAASAELDLAALQLDPAELRGAPPIPLELGTRALRKGEPVVAIGYPGAADEVVDQDLEEAGFEATLTGGSVSRVLMGSWQDHGARFEMVQHTAALSPGNSGGPLVDRCGRVIGVNTASARGVAGIYLASSARTMTDFLAEAGLGARTNGGSCDGDGAAAAPSAPEAGTGTPTGREPVPFWVIGGGIATAIGGLLAAMVAAGAGRGDTRRETVSGQVALTLSIRAGGAGFRRRFTREVLLRGLVVGRGAGADLEIDNPRISREHLRLALDGRLLMATDLGSTNGTLVDGRPLPPHQPRQIGEATVLVLGGAVEIRLRAGP